MLLVPLCRTLSTLIPPFNSIPTHLLEILRYAQDDMAIGYTNKNQLVIHEPTIANPITFHASRFSTPTITALPGVTSNSVATNSG
jgi:hypothetical protein